MNRKQIQDVYQTMTPDGSAKQRMLERILDQGEKQLNQEYCARIYRSGDRKGIVAAVLVLVLTFGGVTTLLSQRENNQLGEEQIQTTTTPVRNFVEDSADWGVTLLPSRVSRTGAKAVFRNTGIVSDGVLTYDEYMILERFENGEWVDIIHSGRSSGDLTLYVKNGEGESYTWERSYGELPDGRYRMGMTVTLTFSDGTSAEQIIYGEFSLPESIYTGPIPLEELPEDYSWEQAVMDGCFVQVNGEASGNHDIFYTFSEQPVNNQPQFIRIVHIFNQDENFSTVYDLTYDGSVYTISWLENGQRQTREYRYLRHFYGLADNKNADYHSYVHYVLVNDDTALTWKELWQSLASSQSEAAIDHITVFSRYIGDGYWEPEPYDAVQIDLEFRGEILYTITAVESLEKASLMISTAEILSYAPQNHGIGIGLNLILTTEAGEVYVFELDPKDNYFRIHDIYWRYGEGSGPNNIALLWKYLGIEAWPAEVYEAYPDAYRE